METTRHPSLTPLNQTAAVLMAAAACELFPGVLFIEGQGTPDRFFCDFVFPFTFQPDFITLIEERMRLIVREKREVKSLEMMPENAAAMLRHRGQPLAAEALLLVERALVELCQIGDFAALAPAPFLDELAIPHLKIFEGFPLPSQSPGPVKIRIVGAAAPEKDVLKKIAKQPPVSSRFHQTLSEEMQLLASLEEGLWTWRPRGEVIRQQLIALLKKECDKENFEWIATPAAFLEEGRGEPLTRAHREYAFRFGAARVAEVALIENLDSYTNSLGFLSPRVCFADRAHIFCPDEKLLEESISSLQFIRKIPKILGFEFEIVLSISGEGSQKARAKATALFKEALEKTGVPYTVEKSYRAGVLAGIEVRIPDALGRRWTGPFVAIPEAPMPVGKGSMLIRSGYGSLERIAALLLEQKGGWLPLCIAPEQVRILVATGKTAPYAKQVRDLLRQQGIRATLESGEQNLKTRLYKAIAEKVPYLVLLGEREEKNKTLTVRSYGESEEQTVSLDTFCMRLKSETES